MHRDERDDIVTAPEGAQGRKRKTWPPPRKEELSVEGQDVEMERESILTAEQHKQSTEAGSTVCAATAAGARDEG